MRASHAAPVSVDAPDGQVTMGVSIDIDGEDDLDDEDLMTAEIEIDEEDWDGEVSSDDDLFFTADDVTG